MQDINYWMLKTLILNFLQEFLKSYESQGRIKVIVLLSGLHPMYSLCHSVLDKFHNWPKGRKEKI